MKQVLRKPLLWIGIVAAACAAVAAHEWPYINWEEVAVPVDQKPLVIRRDAKGDGHFGSRRSGNRRHRGIDLAAPLNSPVRAVRSGRVVKVSTHKGLGHYVELEHGKNLRTLYAHLNEVQVETGMRIRQGQAIGTIGKTGNAKHPWITPHVHLEIVKNNAAIDPAVIGLRVSGPQDLIAAAPDAQDESMDAAGGE